MKIFLDTADLKMIKQWAETGILDGITTNPTHLSKSGGNPTEQVKKISKLLPHGEISVEVTEKEPKKVYEQAKKIAAIGNNIIVKIPCHADYYSIIDTLCSEDIPLNITLVFTVIQGLMMCKLGARYISPFVGRWDDIAVDGVGLLYEMRQMIDTYDYPTGLLAASLRTVRNFHDAIMAGADVATLPPDILKKATEHVLTDQGIEKFDADWQKLGVKKFP